MSIPIKLTQFAHGSGCGCKISPSILREMLQNHRSDQEYPSLLVGNAESDDASVMDLGDGSALVSTTDFFMPIVDDATDFGSIAAANALSDVYAMGGLPLMAIAILGWPVDKLPASLASEVMQGARNTCKLAGIPIAGGHTIDSPEPFFGLAVSGKVAIANIKRNSTAKAGDLLYLTKPLGMGILTTASRRGLADSATLLEAVHWMKQLNTIGAECALMDGVHAMTDVTGFGLLGHLQEMCDGSGLSAEISFKNIPQINCVKSYLDSFIYPDMTMKTFSWLKEAVSELTGEQLLLLCDPQTSGGLLIAVDPKSQLEMENLLINSNCPSQSIGHLLERGLKTIFVKD